MSKLVPLATAVRELERLEKLIVPKGSWLEVLSEGELRAALVLEVMGRKSVERNCKSLRKQLEEERGLRKSAEFLLGLIPGEIKAKYVDGFNRMARKRQSKEK